MTTTTSTQAKAAKAIRKELKDAFPGIKFSVRSSSFAGGNDVTIDWTDGPTRVEAQKITGKYQYGNFDGMTDCYEYSNGHTDIPQAKYVMCQHRYSDDARREAANTICERFGYEKEGFADRWYEGPRCYGDTLIYRELQAKDLSTNSVRESGKEG